MAKFVGNNDKGSDSRFFTTQKKGEMHELRMELHSTDRGVKVDAVKKVIASMTVGKDVSMLFTDVLNCVQTGEYLSYWNWPVFSVLAIAIFLFHVTSNFLGVK